ncbi:hypothetical protein H920_08521 [Fukomys damarensis]|uniref:Uncharacterized protein n=1 Tax=Fukomys damarensis TaxID=885580 RepID=A0A091DHT9_FUKDA|nr:hypothetical protein H920_08521 [Fukomys damarensis]
MNNRLQRPLPALGYCLIAHEKKAYFWLEILGSGFRSNAGNCPEASNLPEFAGPPGDEGILAVGRPTLALLDHPFISVLNCLGGGTAGEDQQEPCSTECLLFKELQRCHGNEKVFYP